MQRATRQQSQAQTRERLLKSARSEFARRGIGGASIDRISEAAGFSRGAFYANYGGKHDLLLELLARHQREEIAAWQDLIAASSSLTAVLPQLSDRFDTFARSDDDVLFSHELQIEALRNPEFAARYRELSREIGELTQALAEAMIRRAGGSRVSAAVLGKALQSFSPQFIVEYRLGLRPEPGAALVATIVELLGTGDDVHGEESQS